MFLITHLTQYQFIPAHFVNLHRVFPSSSTVPLLLGTYGDQLPGLPVKSQVKEHPAT